MTGRLPGGQWAFFKWYGYLPNICPKRGFPGITLGPGKPTPDISGVMDEQGKQGYLEGALFHPKKQADRLLQPYPCFNVLILRCPAVISPIDCGLSQHLFVRDRRPFTGTGCK